MSGEIVREREGDVDERKADFWPPISITALPTPTAHPRWQFTPISVTQLCQTTAGVKEKGGKNG